ncbi:hypothetical protein DF186_19965, partial [Enterococcus hirae]
LKIKTPFLLTNNKIKHNHHTLKHTNIKNITNLKQHIFHTINITNLNQNQQITNINHPNTLKITHINQNNLNKQQITTNTINTT